MSELSTRQCEVNLERATILEIAEPTRRICIAQKGGNARNGTTIGVFFPLGSGWRKEVVWR